MVGSKLSLYLTNTKSPLLKAKSQSEVEWVNKVVKTSDGHTVLIKWYGKELQGKDLLGLIK